jgi:hypothetical protein
MAKKMSKKAIDREIDRLYKIHAEGLSINIMDIGKVFKAGHAAVEAGTDLEAAVEGAVATYCEKLP